MSKVIWCHLKSIFPFHWARIVALGPSSVAARVVVPRLPGSPIYQKDSVPELPAGNVKSCEICPASNLDPSWSENLPECEI